MQPIGLPTAQWNNTSHFVATGWGGGSGGSVSAVHPTLKQKVLRDVGGEPCRREFGNVTLNCLCVGPGLCEVRKR